MLQAKAKFLYDVYSFKLFDIDFEWDMRLCVLSAAERGIDPFRPGEVAVEPMPVFGHPGTRAGWVRIWPRKERGRKP